MSHGIRSTAILEVLSRNLTILGKWGLTPFISTGCLSGRPQKVPRSAVGSRRRLEQVVGQLLVVTLANLNGFFDGV